MNTESYLNVLNEFENILKLPPREKYKKLRTVAYHAECALDESECFEEIELYSKIFKMAGNSWLLNKAKLREFKLKGIDEIKTIKTKLGLVMIESGLIAVGDPKLGPQAYENEKSVAEEMNMGNFYCISTASDGGFDVTLRLVDCEEPFAEPKEYKFIENNSKTSFIKIESGFIKCADFWDLRNETIQSVGYELEKGFYKVAFYRKLIRDKYAGYVVVLSKSPEFVENKFDGIETVE